MKTVRTNLLLVVGLSIAACLIYTLMLGSPYNHYFYTSSAKLGLFILAPLLYFILSKQGRFKDLFRVRGNKKYMKLSALLGIGTFAVIIIGFVLLKQFFDRQIILNGLAKEGITTTTYPIVFVNIVVVNAFLEELFFRGFVFFGLHNLGHKMFAHIFSSVLFAVYHIAMMNSWFSPGIFLFCLVGLIGAGVLFNELDRRCENICGGFFLHLGANLAINLIGVYLIYIAV